MARGRPRKKAANLPAHIDVARIPAGLYWSSTGAGRWYVLEPNPDEGGTRKVTVAHANAKLSELHAIAEARAGGSTRGTVNYVGELFDGSPKWKTLAAATQRDYRICAAYLKSRPFGRLLIDRLNPHNVQRLVDEIATGKPESRPGADDAVPAYPSKAAHVLRYLRRLCGWGIQRGHCATNPAKGVESPQERRLAKVPQREVFARVLAFARERGARKAHTRGSCPPYLAPAMELAYGIRLRGIEVTTLTDAHALEVGILSNRRKGSLDNITRWTPRLRAAWAEAVAIRKAANTTRDGKERRPVPLRPEDRFLFVDQSGVPLRKGALDKAWQALMRLAMREKVITEAERFTLHGLKHRGVSDTAGTRAEKKDASGHRTDAAFDLYDHELQLVNAAGEPAVEHGAGADFSPEFSPRHKKGTQPEG